MMQSVSQAWVEPRSKIDKHTSHIRSLTSTVEGEKKRKKDSVALPPPLQTFLKHLHSLNILAGVVKKKKKLFCSAPVMFVH